MCRVRTREYRLLVPTTSDFGGSKVPFSLWGVEETASSSRSWSRVFGKVQRDSGFGDRLSVFRSLGLEDFYHFGMARGKGPQPGSPPVSVLRVNIRSPFQKRAHHLHVTF